VSTRTALLLGGTGLVGSRCVAHLLTNATYARVVCLVRRAGAIAEHGPNVVEQVVDFGTLREDALPEADDVYCAIGSTMKKAGSREAFRQVDYDVPLHVAKLAAARGAKRMALVSSIGADPTSSNFYLRTKGELEGALAALPFTALHVFRPSFLVGDREESRPGEAIGIALSRATAGLLIAGLRKYRPIGADDVARAMVAAAVGADPAPPLRVYEHDAILSLART
jgi:uncharacterized protein YbjT (DUF2867 family)